MNAISHSKFNLPLYDLIQADADECAASTAAQAAGLPTGPLSKHHAIMAFRCTTLVEIRASCAG